jgi:hypothetical protein
MKSLILVMAALFALSASGISQGDQSSSKMLYTGRTVFRSAEGKMKPMHISIRRLRLESDEDIWQSLPVADFSIMTVYSGRIETMIDGKMEVHGPGDYWSLKAGSVLKERALKESAILQIVTIKR